MTKRVAAVDCGTNSIRLLIADIDDAGQLADVRREMRVVRLGQGVDSTGEFAPEALERTFAAIDEYAGYLRGASVEADSAHVRFVATSATRDAANREEFLVGVRSRLGVDVDVVPGTEEAQLSFTGATSVLEASEPINTLVVDLGGGSTEFVFGPADGSTASVKASISTNMGCVRFTERFLKSDPPTTAELDAARAAALDFITEAAQQVPFEQVERVIGVAGTVTTITAHALGLDSYQPERIHGAELRIDQLRQAATELTSMTRAQRAELPYMHRGRVDVIGTGALLWSTILDQVASRTGGRITTAVTSKHDILDGIALSLR